MKGRSSKNRLNTTLVKIARSPLIDSGNYHEAIHFILEQAAAGLDVERTSVWCHSEERDQIRCINMYIRSEGRHTSGLEMKASDFPEYFDCLKAERVVAADDAQTNRHTRAFARDYLIPNRITSMMDTPLRLSGKLLGILCHEHVGPPRHWTLIEQYFAGVVGEMIARAYTAQEMKQTKVDLQRVNTNLEKMNQRLAKINREKDELLMMVSHELKTPLHVIGGWADLLIRGEVEGGQIKQAYETIARNVEAQSHIVDDLLDTSRIVLGRLVLNKKFTNVAAILGIAVQGAKFMAERKNQTIQTEILDDKLCIMGDLGRIEQIISNLLANAVKYTPEGGSITVSLSRVHDMVQIQVRDTGEGLEPSLLPVIFERFSQGDSSVTRSHGGLGLGLAIAKHLVEAHGGRISAESPGRGKGSTFTVLLPVAEAKFPSMPGTGGVQECEILPLKHVKLLVVEDEPDSRTLAEVMLREQGATVESAGDAEGGIQHLKNFKPDLLLCDLAMPGEDGFSLLERIRLGAVPGFERIPAIAVSAFTDLASQSHALGSGYQEFVAKPLNQQIFINAILRVLRRKPA